MYNFHTFKIVVMVTKKLFKELKNCVKVLYLVFYLLNSFFVTIESERELIEDSHKSSIFSVLGTYFAWIFFGRQIHIHLHIKSHRMYLSDRGHAMKLFGP